MVPPSFHDPRCRDQRIGLSLIHRHCHGATAEYRRVSANETIEVSARSPQANGLIQAHRGMRVFVGHHQAPLLVARRQLGVLLGFDVTCDSAISSPRTTVLAKVDGTHTVRAASQSERAPRQGRDMVTTDSGMCRNAREGADALYRMPIRCGVLIASQPRCGRVKRAVGVRVSRMFASMIIVVQHVEDVADVAHINCKPIDTSLLERLTGRRHPA